MLLIGLAGLGAGAINALVGSGTLITFPTLVALGYPPVTATMSNAVGLVAGSVSGTWGYRAELRGQWDRLRWQIPASVGGAALGAFLLLHLPEKVFARIVPALLVLALLLVLIGPWIQSWARRRAEVAGRSAEHITPVRMAVLVLGTFAVGVYGGYFTAAQGILLVGVMGALLPESVQRMNAAKNLLDAGGECRCGDWLYVGGLRSHQLAGCRRDRGGLADRGIARGALRASVVAECVARHHRRGRADRAVPPAHGVMSSVAQVSAQCGRGGFGDDVDHLATFPPCPALPHRPVALRGDAVEFAATHVDIHRAPPAPGAPVAPARPAARARAPPRGRRPSPVCFRTTRHVRPSSTPPAARPVASRRRRLRGARRAPSSPRP